MFPRVSCALNFGFEGIELVNRTDYKESNEQLDEDRVARSVDFYKAKTSDCMSRAV
jgi:hypothetical protein